MKRITESIERHSLTRLLKPVIHIDQYKSKMGEDADIIVISFKIKGKEAANDLVDFLEKGYDWVLDADTSAGELDDGDYLVFLEVERTKDMPSNFMKFMVDLRSLADIPASEWTFSYHRGLSRHPVTKEHLAKHVPLTQEEYDAEYGKTTNDLDELKVSAGMKVDTKAPTNEFTESLRIAAGIR